MADVSATDAVSFNDRGKSIFASGSNVGSGTHLAGSPPLTTLVQEGCNLSHQTPQAARPIHVQDASIPGYRAKPCSTRLTFYLEAESQSPLVTCASLTAPKRKDGSDQLVVVGETLR